MIKFSGKNYLITGGNGFLGNYVRKELVKVKGDDDLIFTPRSSQYDLRNPEKCKRVLRDINVVIHLAANCGGIQYNKENPYTLFYDNAIMGLQLMDWARRLKKISKFVTIGTVCSYPKFTPTPFKEKNLWKGYPEETNAPYGLAKKMLLVQSQTAREQFGFNGIYLMPVNLYGEGDCFDENRSHVIPALIRKIQHAIDNREREIEVWGDGSASREFIHAEDAARGIVEATLKYNKPEPVNIGSGQEITIKDLVHLLCNLMGYRGSVEWQTDKPNGQPRRCLDTSKAKKEFGFKAKIGLEEGLMRTINWYRATR